MKHAADILLGARFALDLYVNYRPVRCLDDRLCPLKGFSAADVDFVVFRENTEGSYVGAGGHLKKGTSDEVAVQEDVSTRKGVERIIRYAFEYARARGRRRVVDVGQVQRHALRRGPLAASLLRGREGVPRRRGLPPLHRRALHADGQGPAPVRRRS